MCARSLARAFPPSSPPASKNDDDKKKKERTRASEREGPRQSLTAKQVNAKCLGNERAVLFRSATPACIHHPSVDATDALLCFVCLFVVGQEAPTPTEATRTEQSAGERRRREAGGRLLAASQPAGQAGRWGFVLRRGPDGRTDRQTRQTSLQGGGV